MKKIHNIWVIGAGGIGSRHLQALKKIRFPLRITVIDPSEQSLNIAKERYNSMPKGSLEHEIEYENKIPKIKKEKIDIAIIATRSDVRATTVKELLKYHDLKYLLLEKILFNNKRDYSEINKIIQKKRIRAWINCPMRMMPTYQKIEKYFKNKRISYLVTWSKFGLMTSAIHYLDHVSYLSDTTEFKVNTVSLDPKPAPSKRSGFLEFNGTLTAHFRNGSNVSLTCYSKGSIPIIVEINTDNARYIGRESEGKAWLAKADNNWQWEELEAPIPFQSQLTTTLIENILTKGKCNLASYEESKKIHLNMLEPLKIFLNKNLRKKYTNYPFT